MNEAKEKLRNQFLINIKDTPFDINQNNTKVYKPKIQKSEKEKIRFNVIFSFFY